MSSNQTILYGHDGSYYLNLDESRYSGQFTNQFSLSQQSKDQKNLKQSDKKDQSVDLSHMNIRQLNQQMQLGGTIKLIKPRIFTSLIPSILCKKTTSSKSQITIYFFNSQRRLTFHRQQLSKSFGNPNIISINKFIIFILKQYCILYLNFQPYQILQQSFQLRLADHNNQNNLHIDPFDYKQSIDLLFHATNLILTRKEKSNHRINDWKQIINHQKNYQNYQIIQILMPNKKELIEQIDKNKTINYIKEKILSYNNQLGKIILLTYNTFKLCQGKKRICDIQQRIFQVYRQKIQSYLDKPIIKTFSSNHNQSIQSSSYNNVTYYQQLWKNSIIKKQYQLSEIQSEIYVNNTIFYGKFMVKIVKTVIYQKYIGGLIHYYKGIYHLINKNKINKEKQNNLANQSGKVMATDGEFVKEYSIHTLVGINNQVSHSNSLHLKFLFKNRHEIRIYNFQHHQNKLMFLKNLLKIGRVYNKIWKKI